MIKNKQNLSRRKKKEEEETLPILPRERDFQKGKSGYLKQKQVQNLLFDWARSEAIFMVEKEGLIMII